jgi:CRP-like cAMP-binding protein
MSACLPASTDGTSIVIKNKVKVDTMYKGAFFGEIALVLSRPRTASIRASTSVEVYKLCKSDFEATLRQYPGIKTKMRRAALERYRHSSSSSTVMLIQRFAAELESAAAN